MSCEFSMRNNIGHLEISDTLITVKFDLFQVRGYLPGHTFWDHGYFRMNNSLNYKSSRIYLLWM